MKPKLRAYKITFPNYLTKGERDRMWNDPDIYSVIYGPNMAKALNEFCKNNEDVESYFEIKKQARARRFEDKDVFEQERHQLIKKLSIEQIFHLTHSLGVNVGDICPDSFYRNYSVYYELNDNCEALCSLGLMYRFEEFNSFCYKVTYTGIEVVKTLLLLTKEQENNKTIELR